MLLKPFSHSDQREANDFPIDRQIYSAWHLLTFRSLSTSGNQDKNHKKWMERFQELQEYKAIHGNCRVPTLFGCLGTWVKTQRGLHTTGNLMKDKQEMLESIGFEWRLRKFVELKTQHNEDMWNSQYDALVKYKEMHGDTLVPRYYPGNKELGIWVNNQRRNMKNGTFRARPDRKAKLEDLGFVWDPQEHFWDAQYNALVKYKEEHGDTLVPKDYPENKELGLWVTTQRASLKNGTLRARPDRKAKLEELGFIWDPHEHFWEAQYDALVKCKEKHGDTRVPRDDPENKELGFWVNEQRRQKKNGTLQARRKAKLHDLGFVWDFDDINEEAWLESFEQLKWCYANPGVVFDSALRAWTILQCRLHAKGSLAPHRKALLDEIGFEW
ncbi:helicase [Seminavis robusta]|uniref:Helicase n=1 Tax=Seminavis robusta TaxID=568900 RepID=A0A9N8EPP8_9STRA|nr:helicase [Seminavis robusta]|eukprot:Sro1716_g293140.1 helicase (384) ;mRNA; f:4711-5862